MDTNNESMHRFFLRLHIAAKHDSVSMMLETLVRVAELLREQGETKRAFKIMALTLCYPLPPRLRDRAEQQMLELAAQLSPFVVQNVMEWTESITLDEMVTSILADLV
jgi:hypothetical protein